MTDKSRYADERSIFFAQVLEDLRNCGSYDGLETKCVDIHEKMKMYQIDYKYMPSIMNTGLTVDEDAIDLCPADTVQQEVLYPVNVLGDGNCLPYTGSIHGFGNALNGIEMRVRILVEAVRHKKLYLSQAYLERGHVGIGSKNLSKAFSFYSDEYYPPDKLEEHDIENIYKKEIMKIRKNKRYMGIWQIFALASVLAKSVFSVYPKLGNKNVRIDLHRTIEPRENKSSGMSYIMWSSTRKDLTMANWVPNHFVAVLPVTTNEPVVLGQLRATLIRERKLRKKSCENLSSSNKDNIDEETLGAGNDNESKTKQESNDKMNNVKMDEHVDHKTVVNETIKDRGERKPENKNKNSEKEGNVGNDSVCHDDKKEEKVDGESVKKGVGDSLGQEAEMGVQEHNESAGQESEMEGQVDNDSVGQYTNMDMKIRSENVRQDNKTEIKLDNDMVGLVINSTGNVNNKNVVQDSQMEVKEGNQRVGQDTEIETEQDSKMGVQLNNNGDGHAVTIEEWQEDNYGVGQGSRMIVEEDNHSERQTKNSEGKADNDSVEESNQIDAQLNNDCEVQKGKIERKVDYASVRQDSHMEGQVEQESEMKRLFGNDINNNNAIHNIQISKSKNGNQEEKESSIEANREKFGTSNDETCIENLSPQLLSPDDLIGRYVFVRYDKQPYPGVVTDADETEVYIRCMHRVGKASTNAGTYY